MGFGNVALGDGQEAREARFGREEVVERRIAAAGAVVVREAIADREQLTLRVVQESEVDAVEDRDGAGGERVEMQPLQRDRQRDERAREVAAVDGRDVAPASAAPACSVSYQFSRWPSKRSRPSTVVSVVSIRGDQLVACR